MVGGNNQLMIGARTDLHSVPSWRKAKLAQNMRLQPPYTKQSAHTQNIPRRRVNENNTDNITAAQDFSNQNRMDTFISDGIKTTQTCLKQYGPAQKLPRIWAICALIREDTPLLLSSMVDGLIQRVRL